MRTYATGEARTATVPKLACDGGTPVRQLLFPPWPSFADDEIAAAMQVLCSGKVNYWTGNQCRLFEREFADFLGRAHAVALANGTVALEAALYAFGIGPGDEVIVPCRTFIASASCAVMRGAKPVVADVDPISQNLTAESIRGALTSRTKAIVAVHLAGWPCDMDPILALAREYRLKVIEDCAQAHGATYKGRPAGSMGDAAAFSFCQDKIITTGGEGGMLVLDDDQAWQRAWSLKEHGKDYAAASAPQNGSSFRWLHRSFGTNWRMTEMQAAIGRLQLRKLANQLSLRRRNAAILTSELRRMHAIRVTIPPPEIEHAYYKYYAFLSHMGLREEWTRDRFIAAVNAEGVPCFSGCCGEIYLEGAFPPALRPARRFPVARDLAETSLMFLVHPTLSRDDMLDVCQAVRKVMAVAALPSQMESAA